MDSSPDTDVATDASPDGYGGVVVGNHCHKYTTSNPLIRWLTVRFLDELDRFLDAVDARVGNPRVLEVGCGEGEIARRLHGRWSDVTALDLPDTGLRDEWSHVAGPRFLHADAERLPFADASFDVVVCVEVLEHLVHPEAGLSELARVALGGHMIMSVPREPLFRMGNLFTGRHVVDLGNTPGHLNHWSSRGFERFVGRSASVRALARPFPWTMVWAESTAG